jgi:hypothetical protein
LEVRLLKLLLEGVKMKPSLEAVTVYCPPEVRLVNLYVPSESVVAVVVFAPLRLILTPPSPAPLASVTRPEIVRVGEGVGEGEGVGVGWGDSFVLDESDFR